MVGTGFEISVIYICRVCPSDQFKWPCDFTLRELCYVKTQLYLSFIHSRGEVLEDEIAFYIYSKVIPQPLDKSKNNCLLSGQAATEEEIYSSNNCVFQLWQMEHHILW